MAKSRRRTSEIADALDDTPDVSTYPTPANPLAGAVGHEGSSMGESDNRRLTKPGKAIRDRWINEPAVMSSKLFQTMADVAAKKFGSSAVHVGEGLRKINVGIPLPALCWEFLLDQDVLSLSRTIQLVGPPHSGKTPLSLEFGRWAAASHGGLFYLNTEGKFSETLVMSIWSPGEVPTGFVMMECSSNDDWQDKLSMLMNEAVKILIGTKEAPGPGRTIPVFFVVDSLAAKAAEESIERIHKAGHGGRAFPVESLQNSDYFKACLGKLQKWPFNLILVNHVNYQEHDHSLVRNKPGGKKIDFLAAIELETSLWKKKIRTAKYEGIGVKIAFYKNSEGASQRAIKTRFLWWNRRVNPDDPSSKEVRHAAWDWDFATLDLLADPELDNPHRSRLNDAKFKVVVKDGLLNGRVHVPLIHKHAEDTMPVSEFHKFVRQPEIVAILREALGIQHRPVLRGDYQVQVQALEAEEP